MTTRTDLATAPTARFPSGVLPMVLTSLLVVGGLTTVFFDGLKQMVGSWGQEEYTYAYLVPLISAWLIWQKRAELSAVDPRGSWAGVAIVLLGLLLGFFGKLSTIYTIIHYAFVVMIIGVALASVGWRGVKLIWPPLLYLAFMVPLPEFLYRNLSGELQLISSNIGVAFIRMMNISVFIEGNVIDLGHYKLQVVEACSGLRYLFPLMSFGFLCAYLYKGPNWHKVFLFASTLPITVLINSFRIGVTGGLVDTMGIASAEGFLHMFEGWIIFLAAIGLFFGVMMILARISGPRVSGKRASLAELLRLELLWPTKQTSTRPVMAASGRVAKPLVAAAVLLVAASVGANSAPTRGENVQPRDRLALFPTHLNGWHGQEQVLETRYQQALRLDDHFLADYWRLGEESPVNLWVAYYASQRTGASAHSPRSCIPGGGWEIIELSDHPVRGITGGVGDVTVKRAVIAKGLSKQLVYYWFQQRGRHMTSEYMVKWLIFWDALTLNRTDGALVRLVTPVPPGGNISAADSRLADFLREIYPLTHAYIPD
jgi:exosortase D (VPLPA-CTERM-specific)